MHIETKMLLAYIAGITVTIIANFIFNAGNYTPAEVEQLIQEQGYNEYNQGYKEGMLYAYDAVVICNVSPEEEGIRIAKLLGKNSQVSNIICNE